MVHTTDEGKEHEHVHGGDPGERQEVSRMTAVGVAVTSCRRAEDASSLYVTSVLRSRYSKDSFSLKAQKRPLLASCPRSRLALRFLLDGKLLVTLYWHHQMHTNTTTHIVESTIYVSATGILTTTSSTYDEIISCGTHPTKKNETLPI